MSGATLDLNRVTADDLGADPDLRARVQQAANDGNLTARQIIQEWHQRRRTPGPLARKRLNDALELAGTVAGIAPARISTLAQFIDPTTVTDDHGDIDPEAIARAIATLPRGDA